MKLKTIFLDLALFLMVLIPFSYAFDCNQIENKEICLEIQNSDLSQEEKDSLISNLNYDGKFIPDHDYVYSRNSNIAVSNTPNNVQNYNKQFVKEAWLSLFSVMPSVLYQGSLYVLDTAKVQSGYNYRIQIPPDYNNNQKKDGDVCKKLYNLEKNQANNRIYVNDNYQGSGRLVTTNFNSDSQVKAEYDISVHVRERVYKWDRECCDYEDGECVDYCYDCELRTTITHKDNLHLTDSMNVKYYDNELNADVYAIDSFGKLDFSFSDSAKLSFENSEYRLSKYVYTIAYSKEPYYIYTVEAEDHNQESFDNILFDGKYLIVKETDNCKIEASDFFNAIKKECNLDYDESAISIKTDKLKYKSNEEIKVTIEPADVLVKVFYDGEEKEASGKVTFNAKPLKNKIMAEYKNQEVEKIIYVSDKERFPIIYNLSVFGLINYLLYALVRKFWNNFI